MEKNSNETREILVVAAALVRPGAEGKELFIARRAPHDQGAGVWEFPGGKVEEGESLEDALVREIKEELSIEIKIEKYLGQNDYFLTPKLLMHLHVYEVTKTAGEIRLVDHDNFAWHRLTEFPTSRISPADQPFIRVLNDLMDL